MRVRHLAIATVAAAGLAALAGAVVVGAQDVAALQQATPPAGGVWIDSLDLSPASPQAIRRARGGGPGRRGQPPQPGQPPAAPPGPPPLQPIVLGGVTYPHGIPLGVNTDLTIDLSGHAVRFLAVVGLDEAPPAGRGGQPPATPPPPPRGSVTFDVWVDGKHAGDSGLMKSGDAPKLMSVDLTSAKRLVLSVSDGGDGPTGDLADWGGAVIVMASQEKPEVTTPAPEAPPAIASSRSATPQLNSPRITGATPGRPFMFLIPASGEAPLTFAARNLPAGLTLDSKTGLITGSLRSAGTTVVSVTVTGPKGTATGDFTIVGGPHKLALTPPLGWNSWNAWGGKADAQKVREAADGMVASGLARQGYTYINIDDTWEGRERDANGEITTNDKFPDMKGLVDYIHGKGLKAGIYSSPGPTTCARYPATFQHEEQDARTWAKWGFDYIKYDWCSYAGDRNNLDDLKKPYILMRSVLDMLDRDFVLSLCQYGWGNVWEWGESVGGNLWRVTGDITDTWPSMSGIGFQQTGHEKYAGPGHWNDTDMLVVGRVGWGRGDDSRPTNLTPNEQLTHISLWTLQAAPMLVGADMAKIDRFTTDLLGNREVIAVNQDVLGRPAARIFGDGRTDIWARQLSDGTVAVGLFNRQPEAVPMTVKFSDIGLGGAQRVRDLWQQRDLATIRDAFTATVPRHGVVLVKIGAPKRAS